MREGSSAARGALALSIAGILSKVISVLYTPLLVHILGDSGYGVYSKVVEVFLFIYAITSVGAQPAVAKVVAELNALGNKEGAVRTLSISRKFYAILGTIAGISMMLLAFPISKIIESPSVVYGIIALGPCVLITSILSAYRGFMQGEGNMKSIAISQIIEQFLNVILSLLCAFILMGISMPYGVAGAQVGTSVGALAAILFIAYCYVKNEYEEKAYNCGVENHLSDKKIRRKMIRYSIPIIMSAGLQNLGGLVDMTNVSNRLLDIGFAEKYANALYGYYGRYKTLIGVPMVIIMAVSTIVLPSISKARALKDKKEIRNKIRMGFRSSLAISIPAAVGLAMVAEPLYIFLFGRTNGVGILKVGSFILVLMAFTQIQMSILQAINKFYYILFSFGIGIIVKIILNYIFVGIESINIYGVLIGNCFWYLIPAIMNHKKICKVNRMKMPIVRLFFKPLFASLVMALGLALVQKPINIIFEFIPMNRLTVIPTLLIEVAVGSIIYLYLMLILGGIRKADIETISPKIIRLMPRFMRRKLH